ncbi:MAG: hypothetical protein ABSG02_21635 [Terriglobales bacterium]|jgi:hypothetical protein
MRLIWAVALTIVMLESAYAGDDASGPVSFRLDLSQPFTTYSMTAQDKIWSTSLATRFIYKGRAIHFVRTSLPLIVDDKTVGGAVYQAVERPEVFYVETGDAMLKLGTTWAYNPGVGGFSMHAPQSRNFIVCFNFVEGGVPFLSSSPVRKGIVTWKGHDDWDRLK